MAVKQYFDQTSHNTDGSIEDLGGARVISQEEGLTTQRALGELTLGGRKERRLVLLEIEDWENVQRPEAARVVQMHRVRIRAGYGQ